MQGNLPLQPAAVDFILFVAASTAGVPVTSKAIEMPGTFFRVVSANAAFKLKIDSQAEVTLRAGDLYKCPAGAFFKRLVVLNHSTTDTLAVTITVGQGDFSADNAPQLPWPARMVGGAVTTIAGGADIDLPGTPTGSNIQRAQIQVSNSDPNLNLELRDQSGNVSLLIFPQTSVALPLSGFVRIHNPNGSALALAFSELWFYNP